MPTQPRLPFEMSEYERRLSRAREAMAEQGVDLMLSVAPEDIYYLSGFDSVGYYAKQFLALPLEGDPILLLQAVEGALSEDKSWVEDVRLWHHGEPVDDIGAELIAEAVGERATIGYPGGAFYFTAERYLALRERLPQATFVDTTSIVAELRLVKSPAEIEYVRQAGRYSDVGMTAAIEAVAEGVSEHEVSAAMHEALYRAGSEYAGLPFMIASGGNTAHLHATATSRRLERGDPVTLEVGGVSARYNVNSLRTAVVGEPSDRVVELFGILERAVEEATAAVAPGVPVAEIDRITRRITQEYDEYRLHRTGYGTECGYPPAWMGILSIHVDDPHVLEPGMVFSIEPTFAIKEERLGVVLGNQVLVTEDGCEVITKAPLELAQR